MKFLVLIAMILFSPFLAFAQERLALGSNEEVRLRFLLAETTEVVLNTPSNAGLTVRVERVADRSFVRGFGMSKSAREKVLVEGNAILVLQNDLSMPIEISYQTNQAQKKAVSDESGIAFTFHNGSLASIPLVIPGVMNPNLSPMSDSGVTLDFGQKVFFKEKGKSYLLFEVDKSFQDGDRLEIQDLIKTRKKELGL